MNDYTPAQKCPPISEELSRAEFYEVLPYMGQPTGRTQKEHLTLTVKEAGRQFTAKTSRLILTFYTHSDEEFQFESLVGVGDYFFNTGMYMPSVPPHRALRMLLHLSAEEAGISVLHEARGIVRFAQDPTRIGALLGFTAEEITGMLGSASFYSHQ